MEGIYPLFGVMQGRLLPKYKGRYQAHPVGYWMDEFAVAQDFGLSSIEFILDYDDVNLNPLLSSEGIEEIIAAVKSTGVKVNTICADYFMEAPLHHIDEVVRLKSLEILQKLILTSSKLNITDIVIPCVDQSSLKSENDIQIFIESINAVLPIAEAANVNICLETDLAPRPFVSLLDQFPSRNITVNYDTGNSAALGFNCIEEFSCYGERISDIHIKDRKLGGGSVQIGTGDTNFDDFFKALKSITYNKPFILQVYRDEEGLAIFLEQLKWLINIFTKSYNK
jgi:L-ribulose-5-phosphate 3-epimerase